MTTLKGPGKQQTYDGSALRIGIVHARWNTVIIDALLAGTMKALRSAGVRDENIVVQSVPGSYELPYAVKGMWSASQVQSSTSTTGGLGGLGGGAVGDLLGSASDLAGLSLGDESKKNEEGERALGGAEGGDKDKHTTASTAPFDAIIAIGVLIKGETMHFEYIADAVSHGLMKVQLEGNVPVIFGLLTVLEEEQGLVRAGIGGKEGNEGHNHGEDWGNAAVELGVKRGAWGGGRFL